MVCVEGKSREPRPDPARLFAARFVPRPWAPGHNDEVRYFIAFALLVALGAGAWWTTRPKPIPVVLHAVSRGEVRATVSNTRVGTVEACRRAKMSPSAPGQVAQLPVKEGEQVQAGQLLMEIWNEDLKAQREHTQAQVEASLRKVDESCAQAAGSRREANRLARMGERRLISEDALDAATTRASADQAACAAAGANVEVQRRAEAVVGAQIEKTRLRAPFGGVVAEINAKLGEFITPSPTGIPTLPAIDLIDMGCLYVSAPIDEVDAPQIRTGMPACVSMDAFSEKRCNAYVRRIAPYVLDREKQARTVEVEVQFDGAGATADLLPGYSADIEVLLDTRENVLRLPTEAVIKHDQVLVFDPATGRLSEKIFKPGVSNWEYTEVRDGLAEGTRIVVSVGRDGVKPGALVAPENLAGGQ